MADVACGAVEAMDESGCVESSMTEQEAMHAAVDLEYEMYLQERIAMEQRADDTDHMERQYYRVLAEQGRRFAGRENRQHSAPVVRKRAAPMSGGAGKRPCLNETGWQKTQAPTLQQQWSHPMPGQHGNVQGWPASFMAN